MMTETILQISDRALSARPFRGLGAQMDAYIFDDTNKACGVTEDDLEMIARRIRSLRPTVARLFVEVTWFNPSLDGVTLIWDQPGYLNLVRQLHLLRETETQVNLVLFLPYPDKGRDMEPVVRAMLACIDRLCADEKCAHIRWLTLWNEPDTLFFHDSPLYRRIFDEKLMSTRPPWSDYVRLNRLAYAELAARGHYPGMKLLVADTTWGAQMRLERMRMSLDAFADLDVAYGYHNYNPEDLAFYEGNPDYAYAGMAAEAAAHREILGAERELMLWEFNTPGTAGFGTFFLGVGPGGEDRLSSMAGAVDVADKVLAALASGVDGCCLWCLHDMYYGGNLHIGVMHCGLWRFKGQLWLPRPLYHYYAALTGALRPGMELYPVSGCPDGMRAIVGQDAEKRVLVLLNSTQHAQTVKAPWHGPASRLRIYPEILPCAADLPVSNYEPLNVADGRVTLELLPGELTVITTD